MALTVRVYCSTPSKNDDLDGLDKKIPGIHAALKTVAAALGRASIKMYMNTLSEDWLGDAAEMFITTNCESSYAMQTYFGFYERPVSGAETMAAAFMETAGTGFGDAYPATKIHVCIDTLYPADTVATRRLFDAGIKYGSVVYMRVWGINDPDDVIAAAERANAVALIYALPCRVNIYIQGRHNGPPWNEPNKPELRIFVSRPDDVQYLRKCAEERLLVRGALAFFAPPETCRSPAIKLVNCDGDHAIGTRVMLFLFDVD